MFDPNEQTIDDMSLMHLNNCAKATRMGMTDFGFPDYLEGLAILGLTKQTTNGGYQVTEEGLSFLRLDDIKQRLRKL